MNTKLISVPVFVALCAVLAACQSPTQKLYNVCEDIQEASSITSDCAEMATALHGASSSLSAALQDIQKVQNPNREDQENFIQSFALCSRALLEISVGPCKDDTQVKEAMQIIGKAKD